MKRSSKPLNKTSKTARRKIKVVREAKRKQFIENRNYCEICGNSDVTPAHLYKRRHCNSDERLALFAVLCVKHHQLFELLGEARNAAILSFIISRRDFEETNVDFDAMSNQELKVFADRLILETV